MKRFILLVLGLLSIQLVTAQPFCCVIPFQEGEYWWGGVVGYGSKMPYITPVAEFDLALKNQNNQVVPLFVSNQGRYIWSDKPFKFSIGKDTLFLNSDYEQIAVSYGGKTLREAYLKACQANFPPTGTLPDQEFFTMPQYNTWIELMYNQNQKDILNYARQIIENDFPSGILMIDDNWQRHYGNFEFKPDKFPDPKQMVDELHQMGFKVMLWICPFVSADSPEYRALSAKGYLVRQKGKDKPAMIEWWNGYSASYDFTNPEASAYFVSKLKEMQTVYGIDGFKFDAGDNAFYNPELIDSYKKDAISVDHTAMWMKIGLEFPVNEYRAGWAMGGQPLVQRLGDKAYSWRDLRLLIPDMIAAGLLGYAYTCPDMIGGGQYGTFLNVDEDKFDQDLIVRSAQVHALMPMMQFSVAPWRILSEENLARVREMAKLHERMGEYILESARKSSVSGEPIVRSMEYAFPAQGYELCKDQFMLGEKYLVAPVVNKENKREVKLPAGKWRDDKGKVYKGGEVISVEVSLDRLLYFEKL